MTRQQDTRQRDIPYEDADAALAERRNSLNLALQRVECDCHMAVLVQWIFNTEQRTGEPLQKTYRELAQRPHGLCCSPAKARATVGLAKQKGLIRVDEQRYKSGGQEANAYTIYWDGISTILRGRRYSAEQRTAPKASPDGSGQVIEDSCGQESSSYSSAADGSAVEDQDRGDRGESCDDPNALAVASSPPGPGALRAHPSAFIEQGGAMGAHPSAPRKQPYIGNTLSLPSLIPLSSQRTGSGPAPTPKVREDKVRGELIQEIPELAAAVLREVRPLPPEKTLYGAIAALDKSHFHRPLAVAEWFRRQLASPRPLGKATEADFLLAFAAILYAAGMDLKRVRVSQLGIAGAILGHQRWRKSLPSLPLAIRRLRELKEQYGAEIFLREDWPPPRIETKQPRGDGAENQEAGEGKSWEPLAPEFKRTLRERNGPPAAPS